MLVEDVIDSPVLSNEMLQMPSSKSDCERSGSNTSCRPPQKMYFVRHGARFVLRLLQVRHFEEISCCIVKSHAAPSGPARWRLAN